MILSTVGDCTDRDSEQSGAGENAVDIDFEWEAYYSRCQPLKNLETPNG